jgi:flagellar hook-basal body complex protein FliE
MITPQIAARAYAAAQNTGIGQSGGAQALAGGPDFGEMLKNVVEGAVQQSRHAETQMAAHVQGRADLVDVVTAISSAETSLETVIAIRDQVISAYQEVMRMTI